MDFYSAGAGWQTTTLGGGSLSIAAGYKGMVRIPWSAFSQSTWQNCGSCDMPFDTSKVLQIQFGFGPKNQIDNILTIDQIGLYALSGRTSGSGGGTTPDPVDHPSPPSWATITGTHNLEYEPGPVDNPLKGFLPFYDAAEEAYFTDGDDWRDRPTQLPYSLEFFYLPLNRLMNNLDDFDWSELDKRLAEVASRGNQSVFRVYLDYPNKPSRIPQFLLDEGVKTYAYTEYLNGKDGTSLAPDYNDERLLHALDNFIDALGSRYDGDPRIGAIMIGLIGFWGEWHTYPYDGNVKSPNLMPTDANLKRVLASIDDAFNHTQLVLRYPMDNDTLKTKNFDVGYHDDSFAFQTLPPSLGGQGWHFWGRVNDAGVSEFWKKNAMGGEMRPEIQIKMWDHDPPRYDEPSMPIEGAQGEDYYTSLNLTHASWLIAQGIFQTPLDPEPLARAAEGSRSMGYEYYVPTSYLDASDGQLKIGVELENRGVAPFYYDWKVELAAQSGDGIVSIWEPEWDLTGILPNTNGFDNNSLFEATNNPALSNGHYQILMRVINPLEKINADAKKFRFANADQNSDGWLYLGAVDVSSSDAQTPVKVTGLTTNTAAKQQLAPGASKQLEVAVVPAEAGNKRIIWSSADLKVAYVSDTGLITATGIGQTVITAKSSDGNFEKLFNLTVSSGSNPPTNGPSASPEGSGAEITENGIKLGQDAVTTVQTTNASGVLETTATIDAKKLQEALHALKSHSADVKSNAVIIELKNDGGSVKINIPSLPLTESLKELPDVQILIQGEFGSYKIPVQALALEALAKKLNASQEDMTIHIVIDKVAGSTADLLSEQAGKEGLALLTAALDYKILAQVQGRSVEIKDFGSTYIERTVHVPGALDRETTTALLFDPDTAAFSFVPSTLSSNGGGTDVVIKRNGNSIYAVVSSGSKSFDDLHEHWAQPDIELLTAKRVINGVSLSSFTPDQPVTRAEFTAMLVRSLGLGSADTASDFSDVSSEDWFADATAIAAHSGLVEGYKDGAFKPNEPITREQMAVILSRALSFVNKSIQTNEHILGKYADSHSIGSWAKHALAELITAQIIKGKTDSIIAPAANATRAEAAVMIKRFLQYVQFMN